MEKLTILFTTLISSLWICSVVQAQSPKEGTNCDSGYCWGEDPGEAKRQHALFSDNFKYDRYNDAIEPMEWLLEHTPFLHLNLYIKGRKIYHSLIDNAQDEELVGNYKVRVLELYDQQANYFGDSAALMNRKGFYLFNYKIGEKDYAMLFDSYNEIFELNGDETYPANLYILMSLVNIQYRLKELTEVQVLDYYDRISTSIDTNLASAETGTERKKWEGVLDQVNEKLEATISLDCDFVRNNMAERIRNNPDDVKIMKRAVAYMTRARCLDDPLYLVAAKNLFNQVPTLGIAESIYLQYMSNKDYPKAMEWLDKGIALVDDRKNKKAEMLMAKAKIFTVRGNRNKARDTAYQAIEANSGASSEAYVLIGDLYFNSSDVCDNSNPVIYRSIFLAAYDMYEKAGNQQAMARAEAQFPSAAEIHTAGYEQGSTIEIGCWIGGTTVIRKRES